HARAKRRWTKMDPAARLTPIDPPVRLQPQLVDVDLPDTGAPGQCLPSLSGQSDRHQQPQFLREQLPELSEEDFRRLPVEPPPPGRLPGDGVPPRARQLLDTGHLVSWIPGE